MRVNIGCGSSPTPGWKNFDNSLSLRLAKVPLLARLLVATGLTDKHQNEFVEFCKKAHIEYADATRRIPLPDGSVEVLYTSHMLEHLEPWEARTFLTEARRVLQADGIIRIAVPDLGLIVQQYLSRCDADSFVEQTVLASSNPRTLQQRLRYLVAGNRHHLWMYDGRSLCRLLLECGFADAQVVPAGETRIPGPGSLDLTERAAESTYVEALNSSAWQHAVAAVPAR
ncbi:class I SAM-dependent methyltransferase [Actinopolymorpha rutila]|uniref:SAM-dependent methyltransferase n=1 Tax=Actinopolymorpha rutila TaxID=446787 RepID=A0A852Z4G7_9ACTN|nr:methyltransferase domain-containing protein [Actinopolymorpha rutila]NYH87721.1 SAM-dependent methyltransferase [Actinopolymorpha rutila]